MSKSRPSQPPMQGGFRDCPDKSLFSPMLRYGVVAVLFAAAFGVRIHEITVPPLDFSVPRQYRSAINARSYYYEMVSGLPEWKTRNARLAREQQGILEPPAMAMLTALAYRVAGGAELWIPRTLSVLAWVIGGVFIWATARRFCDPDAAIVSATVFLFLPFSIVASRTVQPDPLMIMLLVGSVLCLMRFIEVPSTRRMLTAAACTAAGVFVKPVCVFFLLGAFLVAFVAQRGLRRALSSSLLWLFLAVSLLPTAAFYGYVLLAGDSIRSQAQGSFLPHLLMEGSFWSGWLRNVHSVVGFPATIGGLIGVAMVPAGGPRRILIGLWLGYLAYGVVFTYQIHTHDYYHLPLVPIVALSLGPVAAALLRGLKEHRGARFSAIGMVLAIAVSCAAATDKARSVRSPVDPKRFIRTCEQAGAAVNHSDRTVYLAHAYGNPLVYYGELAGTRWPPKVELKAQRMRGRRVEGAAKRLARIIESRHPKFFIVSDLTEFRRQRALKDLLTTQYPLLERTNDYLIFDLE